MSERKLLGLCMIVKDETEFLRACIDSVKDIVDEIVIVDTGSTDGTPQLARELGADVYFFEWNNSFADARNFAMSKCRAKWLLLLDADEVLFSEDKEKLLEFIRTTEHDGALFKVYNYVGDRPGVGSSVHNASRLIRNNGRYRFKGDIHEQIESLDGEACGRFALTDIRLHHYGYLNSVLKKKNKRERNIPILLKELEKDPDNGFMLFNIGNEFMAQRDYAKAVQHFLKSMQFAKPTEAFCPHLYFRTAIALQNLKRYNEALEVLDKGLSIYPGCTDMELLKGYIYSDRRLDWIAIKSFNKAISMGEPHATLRFTDDCATVRPLMALADIYLRQKDYALAQDCCVKALSHNNKLYLALYKISEIAKASGDSEEQVARRMESFFGDLSLVPNLIMLADIMLTRGFLAAAESYIYRAEAGEKRCGDLFVLKAKLHFLRGEFDEAYGLLRQFIEGGRKLDVLVDLDSEAVILLCCIHLIRAFQGQEESAYALRELVSPLQAAVLRQSELLIKGESENVLAGADAEEALKFLGEILKRILLCREFDLFEKLLYNYNYIQSKRVLLHLAKIYYDCDYKNFAASAIISSIKELDTIDEDGVRLMCDCMV